MKYLRVRWKHTDPAYPTMIISEVDAARWEHRKVEIWEDGRTGFADETGEWGGTRLGIEPLPELGQIAADQEFEIQEITKEQFEREWSLHAHS
jgi:hypothetical protein